MGIFSHKKNIAIKSEDLQDANASTAGIKSEIIRKRAYSNILAARLGLNFLFSVKIKASNLYSMYTSQHVIQKLDIADIMVDDLRIDVRLVTDENSILIPKSHFDFNIVPDLYLVLKLNENASNATFLGCLDPQDVIKTPRAVEYYEANVENFYGIKNLKNYIKEKSKTIDLSNVSNPIEIEKARQMIVNFADEDLFGFDETFFYRQLVLSKALRKDLIEFENFEMLSKKMVQNEEIMNNSMIGSAMLIKSSTDSVDLEQLANETFEDFVENANIEESEDMQDNELDFTQDTNEQTNNEQEFMFDTDEDSTLFEFGEDNENSAESSLNLDEVVSDTVEDIEDFSEAVPDTVENIEDFSEAVSDAVEDIEDFSEAVPDTVENIDDFATDMAELTVDTVGIVAENSLSGIVDSTMPVMDALPELSPLPELEGALDFDFQNSDQFLDKEEPVSEPQEEIKFELEDFEPKTSTIENNSAEIKSTEEVFEEESLQESQELSGVQEEQVIQDIQDELLEETQDFNFNEFDSNLESNEDNTLNEELNSLDSQFPDETIHHVSTNEDDEFEIEGFSDEDFQLDENADFDEVISMDSFAEMVSESENISQEQVPISDNIPVSNPSVEEQVEDKNEDFKFELNNDITEQTEPNFNKDDTLSAESMTSQTPTDISENIVNSLPEEDNITDLYSQIPSEDELGGVPQSSEDDFDMDSFDQGLYNQQIQQNTQNTAKKSNPKLIVLLLLIVIGAVGFNKKDDIMLVVNNLLGKDSSVDSYQENMPKEGDVPANLEKVDTTAPPKTGKNQVNLPPQEEIQSSTPQAGAQSTAKTPLPQNTSVYNNQISKISWEVPANVASSQPLKRYLQMAGRSLKLTLQNDLLSATELPLSNHVVVDLVVGSTGEVSNASIVVSSGSNQIDNIVLQSVKAVLQYVKPQSGDIPPNSSPFSLIINF